MRLLLACIIALTFAAHANAQDRRKTIGPSRGDKMLAEYFRRQTAKIEKSSLSNIKTLKDWQSAQKQRRAQLFEMLGLKPVPKKTPLKAKITGKVDHKDFTVENLHFQSRPGLYVTGNFYLPKTKVAFRSAKGRAFAERKPTLKKLPTILYVCGHGRVKKNGISYGNKANYQHHGAWFARNGYACLTIDTLQLGEIEGIHHGTYNHKMWWWNARGYSSAACEAWNCIRALDYLQSRPEVDGNRIGVTGRSGGGAYSWWIAALDERIKVAVPVAGITSLRNHVVDGCVEGHCDCMYPVNTYRWDFAEVASLVAPRPLLISNSDKDGIFPLNGVVDVYVKTRRIYRLYGKGHHLGLQITEGPHRDTQELRVHAFHWFNRFLKQDPAYKGRTQPLIELGARKLFQPEQLKVFKKLPADEINTKIQETFVPKANLKVPKDKAEWAKMKAGWMTALKEKSFRGWPKKTTGGLALKQAFSVARHGVAFAGYDFTSQDNIRLRLFVAHRAGLKPADFEGVVLHPLADHGWNKFASDFQVAFKKELSGYKLPAADKQGFEQVRSTLAEKKWAIVFICPRGIGPTAWNRNERKRTQIRRRFMLLGQTRDGMRVYDIVRAAQAVRQIDGFDKPPLLLQAAKQMGVNTLYASLFVSNVGRVELLDIPQTHREGPVYLNVLRFLDIPAAVAMAADRSRVLLYEPETRTWKYPQAVSRTLGWQKGKFAITRLKAKPKK